MARNFCKATNCSFFICSEACRRNLAILTVNGGGLSLNSHDSHTALSNNLFLIGFINVASQSGDQQGSQDGQDDQNHDQLDQGKTFAVLEFTVYEFFRT